MLCTQFVSIKIINFNPYKSTVNNANIVSARAINYMLAVVWHFVLHASSSSRPGRLTRIATKNISTTNITLSRVSFRLEAHLRTRSAHTSLIYRGTLEWFHRRSRILGAGTPALLTTGFSAAFLAAHIVSGRRQPVRTCIWYGLRSQWCSKDCCEWSGCLSALK